MNNLVYILIGHPLQLKPLIVNMANLVIAYDNYKKVTERSLQNDLVMVVSCGKSETMLILPLIPTYSPIKILQLNIEF